MATGNHYSKQASSCFLVIPLPDAWGVATKQHRLLMAPCTCCSLQVAVLEKVLRGKMSQLSVLSAENQVLRQRERALQVR